MIRYCPALSVAAALVPSMSAGLEASTVTPGSTAPDESFTTPAIPLCFAGSDAYDMLVRLPYVFL
jgi:gentisate 1,2-dioxygenase